MLQTQRWLHYALGIHTQGAHNSTARTLGSRLVAYCSTITRALTKLKIIEVLARLQRHWSLVGPWQDESCQNPTVDLPLSACEPTRELAQQLNSMFYPLINTVRSVTEHSRTLLDSPRVAPGSWSTHQAPHQPKPEQSKASRCHPPAYTCSAAAGGRSCCRTCCCGSVAFANIGNFTACSCSQCMAS
jgi:hypothetical protein